MGVVEGHVALGLLQCFAKFEFRRVGQERAGQNRGTGGATAFDHHAGGGAHHIVGRFSKDPPACGGDLRNFDGFVHLGEENGVAGIV